MRKAKHKKILGVSLGLVILLAWQWFFVNGSYTSGRCGSQAHILWILFLDLSWREYDEYNTQLRWEFANDRKCPHDWRKTDIEAIWPPLHWKVARLWSIDWTRLQDFKVFLEQHKDQVNLQDQYGRTPLHWAYSAYMGQEKYRKEMVELLLSYGADPTIEDENGLVPAQWQLTDDDLRQLR